MAIPPNQRPGADTFHRERSKCVDAFAEVEQAVITVLRVREQKVGSEPFSAKIAKLKAVSPSSRLSKASVGRLPALIARCSEIANLRNDIVHSRLQIAVINEEHRACFINLREDDRSSQTARLMTLQGIRDTATEMRELGNDLRALLSRPSSPPQPSPGAAAGP